MVTLHTVFGIVVLNQYKIHYELFKKEDKDSLNYEGAIGLALSL